MTPHQFNLRFYVGSRVRVHEGGGKSAPWWESRTCGRATLIGGRLCVEVVLKSGWGGIVAVDHLSVFDGSKFVDLRRRSKA
jgi:hypothetical protein